MQIKKNLKILAGQAQPEANERILDIVGSIDRELASNRANFPKKLVHFLERRSYEKALDFIESNYQDVWTFVFIITFC